MDYFAEVWSLDINSEGTMMVGVSADKSIRVYQITQEQIFLEIEKENRLDKVIEKDLQKDFDDKNASYYVHTFNFSLFKSLVFLLY